jgi:hypothetical protein
MVGIDKRSTCVYKSRAADAVANLNPPGAVRHDIFRWR